MKTTIVLLVVFCFTVAVLGACEYVIRPGDTVSVIVKGEPDLKTDATVSSRGKVTVKLAGEMQAAGLTAKQFESAVESTLKAYLRTPSVSVKVTIPAFIAVEGEVKRPGRYPVKDKIGLFEAIAMAGGPTRQATLKNVELIRPTGTGLQTTTVDVHRYMRTADPQYNPALQPGDTICVPRSGKKQPLGIIIAKSK